MNCRLPRTANTEGSFALRIANISCLAATLALLLTHDAIALNRPTVQHFGYSNISNEATELVEILDQGIPQNIWFIDYRDANFIGDDAIDTGPLMFELEALGTKQFLYIDDVLFENVLDPEELSLCDFLNLDGDSSNGGDPFHRLLRSDWTNRLQAWFDLHGEFINAGNTAGIVINAEVNNNCSDMGEVEMAAQAVDAIFQDIPRVILIGRSHWDENNPNMPATAGARPMPGWITPWIDIVEFWSYGIFEAFDPGHVLNAALHHLVWNRVL